MNYKTTYNCQLRHVIVTTHFWHEYDNCCQGSSLRTERNWECKEQRNKLVNRQIQSSHRLGEPALRDILGHLVLRAGYCELIDRNKLERTWQKPWRQKEEHEVDIGPMWVRSCQKLKALSRRVSPPQKHDLESHNLKRRLKNSLKNYERWTQEILSGLVEQEGVTDKEIAEEVQIAGNLKGEIKARSYQIMPKPSRQLRKW